VIEQSEALNSNHSTAKEKRKEKQEGRRGKGNGGKKSYQEF
jgi:hypothetical protein